MVRSRKTSFPDQPLGYFSVVRFGHFLDFSPAGSNGVCGSTPHRGFPTIFRTSFGYHRGFGIVTTEHVSRTVIAAVSELFGHQFQPKNRLPMPAVLRIFFKTSCATS